MRSGCLEKLARAVQKLLLPLADLIGLDGELLRQLGKRFALPRRFQSHLRPEVSAVMFTFCFDNLNNSLRYGFHPNQCSHFLGKLISSKID